MTINRYRYFYGCAFDIYGEHLLAFVDRMTELDHPSDNAGILEPEATTSGAFGQLSA